MAKKEVGLSDSIIPQSRRFPTVFRKRGKITFRFDDDPSHNSNRYEMKLYEYHKGRPVTRSKSHGYWKKGDRISFNTNTDYYVVEDREYMLEVTYYNTNNIEVSNCVFVQVN